MKINLANVKNIDLCYENCEVNRIEQIHLLGINIQRKFKCPHTYKNKATHCIKTFEIALKDIDYSLRRDLAQLTINYHNGDSDHFFIIWGKDDCSWDRSSLQMVHKNQSYISLTSNCLPVLIYN